LAVSPTVFEILTFKAGKWRVLPTPPLFDDTVRGGDLLEFRDETYPAKTREMVLLYRENSIILTSTVFDWFTRNDRRTDGQRDGQRDGQVIACYACYMLSRA